MENQLATRDTGQLMRKFAIPAIISMLVGSLYNIVDQIFIGQGVGLLGNAATNVAFPLTIICTATALLFGIGSAANFNLNSGRQDHELARRFMGSGLVYLGLAGTAIALIVLVFLRPLLQLFGVTAKVLPYALDYTGITAFGIPFLVLATGGNHLIRADGSPTMSMICTLTGAVVNTILDPLFIFSFGWGIQGAAAATVIGQVISGLMVLGYFRYRAAVRLHKSDLRPGRSEFASIVALGMASSINQIAMAGVQVVLNNTLRYYGSRSQYGAEIPLAVVGVISKVNMVFMAVCIGIGQGCQPIWGYNYGAGNYRRVEETYIKAARLCTAVGVVCFLIFQFFPRAVINIFGTGTTAYYRFAERYLRIFMFFTFANAIQPMSSGFFTAMGKARLGVVVSLTRQVLFLVPLILLFPLFYGIDGIMYAGPIADFSAAVVAIALAVREIKKMRRASSSETGNAHRGDRQTDQ